MHIIGGPTTNGLEPFIWSKAKCKDTDPIRFKIIGQVDEYNFPWIEYNLTLW